jgi:hypothetical protein
MAQSDMRPGRSEVATIRLDHPTETQARAFMVADNKLTENSAWDDRLAEQLEALSTMDLDFSLEITGFEIGEIDSRIEPATLLEQAPLASMLVKQNERRSKTTKLRAIVTRLIHQAMQGGYPSIRLLLRYSALDRR